MRLLALLLLIALAACADPPATPPRCGFVGRSALPIAEAGPFATVASSLDGSPASLVIDTGASQSVVSAAAAERARVAPDVRHTVRATGIGGAATYATGRVGRLELGTIPVDAAIVMIMPTVPLADGDIGMDILGDVDLDIDFRGAASPSIAGCCARAPPRPGTPRAANCRPRH